ncbi:MAG: VPLPA-CTERM sorting domain-containing protein [Pseudomonadota bacterium]
MTNADNRLANARNLFRETERPLSINSDVDGRYLFEARSGTVTEPDDINVIPLPAAAWLLLAGLGAIAALQRRRKTA